MPSVQDELQATDDARIAVVIQMIRGTAEQLNIAVLDSILGAAGGMPAAGAASELGSLARRLATATDALGRQLGADRRS